MSPQPPSNLPLFASFTISELQRLTDESTQELTNIYEYMRKQAAHAQSNSKTLSKLEKSYGDVSFLGTKAMVAEGSHLIGAQNEFVRIIEDDLLYRLKGQKRTYYQFTKTEIENVKEIQYHWSQTMATLKKSKKDYDSALKAAISAKQSLIKANKSENFSKTPVSACRQQCTVAAKNLVQAHMAYKRKIYETRHERDHLLAVEISHSVRAIEDIERERVIFVKNILVEFGEAAKKLASEQLKVATRMHYGLESISVDSVLDESASIIVVDDERRQNRENQQFGIELPWNDDVTEAIENDQNSGEYKEILIFLNSSNEDGKDDQDDKKSISSYPSSWLSQQIKRLETQKAAAINMQSLYNKEPSLATEEARRKLAGEIGGMSVELDELLLALKASNINGDVNASNYGRAKNDSSINSKCRTVLWCEEEDDEDKSHFGYHGTDSGNEEYFDVASPVMAPIETTVKANTKEYTAISLYDLPTDQPQQLPLHKGMLMDIIASEENAGDNHANDDWLLARDKETGNVGWVPCNYVENVSQF